MSTKNIIQLVIYFEKLENSLIKTSILSNSYVSRQRLCCALLGIGQTIKRNHSHN